jgi:hypothetical protein
MYDLLYDRIFWIYFIVALFFTILGIGYIITALDSYMLIIAILWLLSIVLLLIIIYHGSIYWSPGPPDDPICVIDRNSQCFQPDNRTWLIINLLFVLLLILSTLWAAELSNPDAGPIRTLSGVLILLGGLILCSLSTDHTYLTADIPFWSAVAYLFIWFGLTMYVTLTS